MRRGDPLDEPHGSWLTGEPIEAALPRTASALSAGEVNFEHATVTAGAIEYCPIRAGPNVDAKSKQR